MQSIAQGLVLHPEPTFTEASVDALLLLALARDHFKLTEPQLYTRCFFVQDDGPDTLLNRKWAAFYGNTYVEQLNLYGGEDWRQEYDHCPPDYLIGAAMRDKHPGNPKNFTYGCKMQGAEFPSQCAVYFTPNGVFIDVDTFSGYFIGIVYAPDL